MLSTDDCEKSQLKEIRDILFSNLNEIRSHLKTLIDEKINT
jgi:hypothetical protein